MNFFKKTLFLAIFFASTCLTQNSFAEENVQPFVFPLYNDAMHAAIDDFIGYFNSQNLGAYSLSLEGDIFYPRGDNTFSYDSENNLNKIELNNLQFKLHIGTSDSREPDPDATITLKLVGNLSPANGKWALSSGEYTIISFTSSPSYPSMRKTLQDALNTEGPFMLNAFIKNAFQGTIYGDSLIKVLTFPFTTSYTNGMIAAANNLVNYINTGQFPLIKVQLKDDLSFPSEKNTFTTDDATGNLNGIKIESLSFNAHVTPLSPFVGPETDITVTLKLEAAVRNCSIVPKTGTYTITSFAPRHPTLEGVLFGNLNNDGDNMLNALIKNSFSNGNCQVIH